MKLIADKLTVLMRCSLAGKAIAAGSDELANSLKGLRDAVAKQATGDRTVFAHVAIALWSRMVSLFRTGQIPATQNAYEVISGSPVGQLANDPNALAASFGEFSIAWHCCPTGSPKAFGG